MTCSAREARAGDTVAYGRLVRTTTLYVDAQTAYMSAQPLVTGDRVSVSHVSRHKRVTA